MANHVSALKRARQTVKRTAVNRANKSQVRKSLRALREAITQGDSSAVAEQYGKTVSALDKSVQKGVLHQNTASRYKSRLHARVKALTHKAPKRAQRSLLLRQRTDFFRRRRRWRGHFVDLDRARAQNRQVLAIVREREILARGQDGRRIGGHQEGSGRRIEDLHHLLAHILLVQ